MEFILKIIKRSYLAAALLQVWVLPGFSQQSVEVIPAKNSILLGEPLLVTVIVKGDKGYDPLIGDSLGRFEVLERLPVKRSESHGVVESRQDLTITSFDSGSLRIPPIAADGNPTIVSPGVDITVRTIQADDKSKYGDIKQIIPLEPPNQWPYIAGLALATLFSAVGIYRLNRKLYRADIPLEAQVTDPPISQTALATRIQQLRRDWLEQKIQPSELGNQLMEVFRKYLSGKGIHASSKTGEELVVASKTVYPSGTWQEIVQSVRLCNAMRFGKYRAQVSEGNEAINAFEKAITPVQTSNAGIKND